MRVRQKRTATSHDPKSILLISLADSKNTFVPWRLSLPNKPTSQARRWLDAETRWPSASAEAWTKRFIEVVGRAPSTVAVVLIGSLARVTRDPGDIDLLYVYDGTPVVFSDHPIDVDIRAYAKQDFMAHLSNHHDVITWALRFGRLLCQQELFWAQLVASFAGELPLPAPEVAEARAERAAQNYDRLVKIGDSEAAQEQRLSLLTHRAWAQLLKKHIHPASRPELPQQLRDAGEESLAAELAAALRDRATAKRDYLVHEPAHVRRAG
jgi:hypothetical protein